MLENKERDSLFSVFMQLLITQESLRTSANIGDQKFHKRIKSFFIISPYSYSMNIES